MLDRPAATIREPTPASNRPWPTTVALSATIALTAVVVAPAAGLVSRQIWRVGGIQVPWGLALAVAGSSAFIVVARSAGRLLGFIAAVAWLVVVFAGLLSGPGGDYVVMQDALGWGFLLGATLAVAVCAGWGSSRP